MNLSRREALGLGAAALPISALLFSSPAGAQQPLTEAGLLTLRDPLLAACLLMAGRRQMGKCRVAANHVSLDSSRDFAAIEIDEHQTISAELLELGHSYPERRDVVGPPQLAIGRAAVPVVASEMLRVAHQVDDAAIDNFQEVVLQLEGIEVDRFFIADQLFAHYQLLAEVETFRRLCSDTMFPLLDATLRTVRRHITSVSGLSTRLDRVADYGAREVVPRR